MAWVTLWDGCAGTGADVAISTNTIWVDTWEKNAESNANTNVGSVGKRSNVTIIWHRIWWPGTILADNDNGHNRFPFTCTRIDVLASTWVGVDGGEEKKITRTIFYSCWKQNKKTSNQLYIHVYNIFLFVCMSCVVYLYFHLAKYFVFIDNTLW